MVSHARNSGRLTAAGSGWRSRFARISLQNTLLAGNFSHEAGSLRTGSRTRQFLRQTEITPLEASCVESGAVPRRFAAHHSRIEARDAVPSSVRGTKMAGFSGRKNPASPSCAGWSEDQLAKPSSRSCSAQSMGRLPARSVWRLSLGLSHKKVAQGCRTGPTRCSRPSAALAGLAAFHGSSRLRLPGRDRRDHQHGSTLWLEPQGRAPDRCRAIWPLANDDIHRWSTLNRRHRTVGPRQSTRP